MIVGTWDLALSGCSCGGGDLVSALRQSVSIAPTDFCMKYHPTLPGNHPAVFLHRFPGRTRPQRAPRSALPKNFFFRAEGALTESASYPLADPGKQACHLHVYTDFQRPISMSGPPQSTPQRLITSAPCPERHISGLVWWGKVRYLTDRCPGLA